MTDQTSVVVLGAGVIGIASAYYLARAGHHVTVVEQHESAGFETSFANGGLITPSMSDPWASPGAPLNLLKWMGRENSPFLIRPSALPGLTRWGLKFLGQCNQRDWERNTETILRLTRFSQACLQEVTEEAGLNYSLNRHGTLHLFRDRLSMESAQKVARVVGELGVSYSALDPSACVALEPALSDQENDITGAIHYPDDEAGDAHLFCQGLGQVCDDMGVVFHYGETIQRLENDGGAFQAVVTDKSRIPASCCVVALGNQSAALLRPHGIRLPIYPVKGYSVTLPIHGWNSAPNVPFVDDGRKIGIVRIGENIRVAGTAEFTGYDTSLNTRRLDNLKTYFMSLFPEFPHLDGGLDWTGLRPTTPDGIPYLGATNIRGLFLNTGHGHLGWTMSCGSAKLVADLVSGRQDSEIDISRLALYGR
jgi:D-amino-acid dehydrogenase